SITAHASITALASITAHASITANASIAPMLHVDSLTFAYNSAPVLRGLSLRVERGETVVIRGASGCGKSTLLRLLARLEATPAGAVRLGGAEITGIPATAYRRRVAYLQQLPVMATGSVRDNLLLPYRYGDDVPPNDETLRERLDAVDLGDVALGVSSSELSIGQQQRVALLRLRAMSPELLLLDEPTASLDDTSARRLLEAATTADGGEGASAPALIIVAHQELPLETPHRTLRMRDGVLEGETR
ncbi:MAG: ATP-binding cassette domain-containing protein, partial [Bacteroidetes bacterium]|nr:ATP-binding cassette domain-containing protein [Bacteroidota bacterium]